MLFNKKGKKAVHSFYTFNNLRKLIFSKSMNSEHKNEYQKVMNFSFSNSTKYSLNSD